jgi:hypothetical protein
VHSPSGDGCARPEPYRNLNGGPAGRNEKSCPTAALCLVYIQQEFKCMPPRIKRSESIRKIRPGGGKSHKGWTADVPDKKIIRSGGKRGFFLKRSRLHKSGLIMYLKLNWRTETMKQFFSTKICFELGQI